MRPRRLRPAPATRSAFAGFRFPPDVIVLAVRWYLRFGLSYRDVEELLAERGIEVDHVTVYRWVLRFAPLLADAARPAGTPSATAGRSMRPTSRWLGSGATSTERAGRRRSRYPPTRKRSAPSRQKIDLEPTRTRGSRGGDERAWPIRRPPRDMWVLSAARRLEGNRREARPRSLA